MRALLFCTNSVLLLVLLVQLLPAEKGLISAVSVPDSDDGIVVRRKRDDEEGGGDDAAAEGGGDGDGAAEGGDGADGGGDEKVEGDGDGDAKEDSGDDEKKEDGDDEKKEDGGDEEKGDEDGEEDGGKKDKKGKGGKKDAKKDKKGKKGGAKDSSKSTESTGGQHGEATHQHGGAKNAHHRGHHHAVDDMGEPDAPPSEGAVGSGDRPSHAAQLRDPCQDHYYGCESYSGLCTAQDVDQRNWARAHCAGICNVCGGGGGGRDPESDCEDRAQNCNEMVGQCANTDSLRTAMRDCAHTCKLCVEARAHGYL